MHQPQQRKFNAPRAILAIAVTASTIVLGTLLWQRLSYQREFRTGTPVVSRVEFFRKSHGYLPANLKDLGITDPIWESFTARSAIANTSSGLERPWESRRSMILAQRNGARLSTSRVSRAGDLAVKRETGAASLRFQGADFDFPTPYSEDQQSHPDLD